METKLVIFVLFVFFGFVINAGFIVGAYMGFRSIARKAEGFVDEFEKSNAREWLESLRAASERAVSTTEMTRQKMTELGPRLDKVHADYQFLLAQVDTKMERIAVGLSENATKVRDAVTEPAERFAATAAGIYNVLSFVSPATDDDDR